MSTNEKDMLWCRVVVMAKESGAPYGTPESY